MSRALLQAAVISLFNLTGKQMMVDIRGLIGNADIISESFLLFLIENERDHIQSVLYLCK